MFAAFSLAPASFAARIRSMAAQFASNPALEALVVATCDAEGLSLVDARLQTEPEGRVLRVLIERPGADPAVPGNAVSLEECTRVSRALSAKLDADEDLIEGTYRLEVSSAGIERPLVKRVDYERFAGREVRMTIRATPEQRRNFKGTLVGLDGDDVVLRDPSGAESRRPFADISKANLVYRF